MNLRWIGLLGLTPLLACAQGTIQSNKTAETGFVRQWNFAQAWRWYQKVGAVRGCNYLPRSAVNAIEMWQAGTFDPGTIEQELGWAESLGYTAVRVFLPFVLWQQDASGLKDQFQQLLGLAERHHLRVMPVLFDDRAGAAREPRPGPQPDPVPGVHNSGWVPSPGPRWVTNSAAWPELERYVKDLVGTYRTDDRVLAWDLYNQPGDSGLGEQSLPLVEAAFTWARACRPTQPLTVGVWTNFYSKTSQRLFQLSDLASFRGYDAPDGMRPKIEAVRKTGRPIFCTGFLRRSAGNTFAAILPLFRYSEVGWFHDGLVAGRTQTFLPWTSKRGDPPPVLWEHDLLHPDGRPFDPKEVELLRSLTKGR